LNHLTLPVIRIVLPCLAMAIDIKKDRECAASAFDAGPPAPSA
jgi:hypothetical protein